MVKDFGEIVENQTENNRGDEMEATIQGLGVQSIQGTGNDNANHHCTV